MANDSEKYIQGAILQGMPAPTFKTNTPLQYADKQRQHLAERTQQFANARAQYSSDFVLAEVQGITEDFYEYVTTYIRLSDVRSNSSVTTQIDDYKTILFADKSIEYFPLGAKVKTMGSMWICANPSNLSGAEPTAILKRCTASFNFYDYYGNIKVEPIVVEKAVMQSNDNIAPSDQFLLNGYFNATCQLNDDTRREIDNDKRIILGSKVYSITGITDFIQEFTGDYDSTHILNFTLRLHEANESDDLKKRIAGGLNRSFVAKLINESEIAQDAETTFKAIFVKDGQPVEPSDEYPITWLWESSDTEIAEVDANGTVKGKTAGTVKITAKLAQNATVTATAELVVKENDLEPYVAFLSVVPSAVEQYETVQITAAYFENSQQTNKIISWTFFGANKKNYKATVEGNTLSIYCIGADDIPLKIIAECEGKTLTFELILEGL